MQYSCQLSSIIQHKNNGNWDCADVPTDALLEAQGALMENFGCSLSWNDVYEWVKVLESRYRTFKQIIDIPQTHWDIHGNSIMADEKIWKKIFKDNSVAQAYYHNGEPEFDKLAILFGHDSIKREYENMVILISDSTDAGGRNKNVTIIVSSDDEITSPIPTHTARSRRRLFDDSSKPTDLESTNNRGHYFTEEGMDESISHYSLTNDFPGRYNENSNVQPSKVNGPSSCASSSPSKWWKNPFK